ncbi:MAG TPA: iron-containing alcohol dehydrogenase [Candidatus Limnocylindria bacterium]|jgi:maleylacetate reductase|nr:iron-containing alcohol dehydrogenase [Candidatus Limnocylindria bacterium]
MNTVSDQQIARRRILFGPLREALERVAPPGPIALLGSRRSLESIAGDAFGDTPVHRYDGACEHNPRTVVDEAGALVDRHACASIVAIGSSSAIDLGKAVADGRVVTLVLVPTALGGAEMSRGYGVLEGDRKAGGRLREPAGTVIYDPALLATLPPRELGSIGINAWAHTIEARYARTEHALGGAAALAAGRELPPLLLRAAERRDAPLHRALFEAAHLAGFALDTRSMGLHHAVCHVIGGLTRIPHGIVNAIVLPHALRANAKLAPDAVAAVAAAFGIADLAARAEAIAAAYELPSSFAELGVPEDLPTRALPRVMQQPLLENNPVRPDERTVTELLARAYGVG